MKFDKNTAMILWIEAIGFLTIITLSWLDELVGLPRIIFGAPQDIDWHEALIETLVVLLAWGCVHTITRRLLKRLHYLEEFMRICAWCRRIGKDEEWLPLEEYFQQKFDSTTTHGMCPDCFKKLEADLKSKNQ